MRRPSAGGPSMNAKSLLLSASLIAVAGCATQEAPPPVVAAAKAPPLPPTATAESEHAKLFDLFKASDEASLKRNPLQALFRGDMRYAEHFGDYITDEYYAAERAASEGDLAALHNIDRSVL